MLNFNQLILLNETIKRICKTHKNNPETKQIKWRGRCTDHQLTRNNGKDDVTVKIKKNHRKRPKTNQRATSSCSKQKNTNEM